MDLQVPGDQGTLGGDPGEHVTAGSDHAGADSGALSVQHSLARPVQTVSSRLILTSDTDQGAESAIVSSHHLDHSSVITGYLNKLSLTPILAQQTTASNI